MNLDSGYLKQPRGSSKPGSRDQETVAIPRWVEKQATEEWPSDRIHEERMDNEKGKGDAQEHAGRWECEIR